jgi:hypothetical protein
VTSDATPTAAFTDAPLGRWDSAAFMATGGALVVHIVVDLPLWIAASSALPLAGCVLALAARRRPEGFECGAASPGTGVRQHSPDTPWSARQPG